MLRSLTIAFSMTLLSTLSFAQPANDDCAGALPVSPNNGCVNGTTILAADNWVGSVGCQGGGNHSDVWYSFTATNGSLDYTVTTSGAWAGDVEFILAAATGPCTGLGIAGSDCGPSVLTGSVNGLQIGTLYYITISNENTGTEGDFQLCINNYAPPVTPGQDCPTAAILCDDSPISQTTSSAGFGLQELTTSNSCWGSGGERQSKWFHFTVGCNGTLEFNINPVTSGDDYDWALYNITTDGCPTTASAVPSAVACNWSGCKGSTGISTCIDIPADEPGVVTGGAGCFGGPAAWETTVVNAVAGETYALLVDNFSASNDGFSLTWGGACAGGTAVIGPDAEFTFTNPSCGEYNFTKTCQTTNSTFLWTFGDGSFSTLQNPSNTYLVTGNYIVTLEVTDALGCTKISSFPITVDFPVATATPNPVTVCSGNAVNIVLSSNVVGTTWEWSAADNLDVNGESTTTQTTAVINNTLTSTSGTSELVQYTVTPTAAGCTGPSITVDVTIVHQPDVNPLTNVAICDSYTLPNLTGTLTGNQAYYTGTGGTGAQYLGGAVINYADFPSYPITLYGFDSTSSTPTCFDEESMQLTIYQSPDLDPIANVSSCDSVQLGTITGPVLTGNQAYYSGTGGTGTTYSPGDWISTSTTIYAYDSTTTNPVCFDEVSFTVTISGGPTPAITPDPAEVCAGIDLVLNGNPAGGSGVYVTHAWTGAGAGSLTPINTASTTFNNSTAASYEIIYTVTDNGGCSGADTILVVVNALPLAAITPDPAEICAGVDISLNGNPSGGSGTYTSHVWSNTGSGSLNSTVIPNPIFNNATGGTYDLTYTVTDDNGCLATDDLTVTVFDNPVIATDTTTPSGCNLLDGSIQVTLTTGPSSMGSISWTGTTSGGPQAVTLPDDITGLGAGSYNVTFTDANGCISNISSEVIDNPGAPSINFIADTTACDTDFTLDYSSITGNNLSTGQAFYYNSGGVGPILDDTVFTAPTNITVYAYDNNGLCDAENSLTIVIYENPTASIIPDPAAVCLSQDLQMNGNPSGGSGVYSSNTWTNTGASSLTNTTIVNPIFNHGVSGPIDLTYTVVDDNGCMAVDNITITVNPAPAINAINNGPICIGETLTLTENGGEATNWNWTSINGSAVFGTSTANSSTASGIVDGEIFQVVISDANGCSDSTTTTVTVNASPTTSITPDPAEVCAGDILAMNGNPSGGSGTFSTHAWTGAGSVSLDATNNATPNFSNNAGGSYNLIYTVIDDNGCSGADTIDVTVFDTPVITPMNDTNVCESFTFPQIVGMNISGNASYWTGTGGTGTEYQIGDNYAIVGTITVFAYDGANGCSSEESFNLTINELPSMTSISGGATYCQGEAVADILVEVAGQSPWTIDYTLNGIGQQATGITSPINLGNAAGTYVLQTLTDASCPNAIVGTETITVNPIPSSPTAGTTGEFCSTVVLDDLNASGSGGDFNWFSDAALTNLIGTGATFSPTSAVGQTSYYVTEIIDGCEGPSSEVLITINVCDIVIPSAFTPDNDGIHEEWEIYNLSNAYPNHVVKVFNRWGSLLYESEKGGYDTNKWNGTFNGELLPVASYYYIIDFNDEEGGSANGSVSIIINK